MSLLEILGGLAIWDILTKPSEDDDDGDKE